MTKFSSKHINTIAAISDIHSNIFALEAVLADIKRRNIEQIVNLGDILYGPIAPKATYELLMTCRDDIMTICGNQDRQIYEATAADIAGNPTLSFIIEDLPKSAIKWMQDLPFDCHLSKDIYLCHGSPTDDMVYLLENIETGQLRARSDTDILALLSGIDSAVVICGHTHIPRTVKLSTDQMVINTGSVGYPAYEDDLPNIHRMQTYSPHANYAIISFVDTEEGKCWQTEHIQVPYDYEAAAQLASQNGREDWAFALRTGRVL
ncbi:metallophosphoesterase family protein [Psychrobacter sp. FME13]|uniref:metallophosphoesterase family protein n=1 Tax=unclassified Psychrobacter TaxID=196806 RepID=UPI001787C7A9|nr:metallophosphoesterase family protein [Psychrobacter sp. FME13]MBE0442981.1 metallophosphoesterase family protein [Psychrobacter sp. FME13]